MAWCSQQTARFIKIQYFEEKTHNLLNSLFMNIKVHPITGHSGASGGVEV
jgi:hypothetical protein